MKESKVKDLWLFVAEIGGNLGFRRDAIYKWIEKKRMLAPRGGCLWKFLKAEAATWLRS